MSFSKDIKKFTNRTEKAFNLVMRGTMLSLFSKVVEASPVGAPSIWKSKYKPKGYTGGRFRNNWYFGTGNKPKDTTEDKSSTGSGSMARLQTGIAGYRNGDTVYFINNLPYSIELEDGTSTQAPWGMVKVNVANLQQVMDQQARKARSK